MKRTIAIILITIILLSICIVLCSCEEEKENTSNRFFEVETSKTDQGSTIITDQGFIILCDKETRVLYLFYIGANKAALTVMLDENGKPLLYEGDLK